MSVSHWFLSAAARRKLHGVPVNRTAACTRILVIRLNRLGDLICALPVYRSLQAAFPNIEIDWLLSTQNAVLAPFIRPAGQVHIYEKRASRYWLSHGLIRRLQARDYAKSVAVKGGYDPLLAWISLAANARERIGYRDKQPRRLDFAYTTSFARPDPHQHQVEKGLNLVGHLLGNIRSDDISLDVPAVAVRVVEEKLGSRNNQLRQFILFQQASTKREFMKWPAEYFIELGKKLAAQKYSVCVNGLQSDSVAVNNMVARIGANAFAAITNGMGEYLALLKRATLVVGADGGGLHLSAGVGTPTIGFYSESHPDKWRPWADSHKQFYTAGKPASEISVDSVWQAILEMLNR